MSIHPQYSASVTPAKEPGQHAYIGQGLFRIGEKTYGGTMCRVMLGDPKETNALAQQLADAWNATAEMRKNQ